MVISRRTISFLAAVFATVVLMALPVAAAPSPESLDDAELQQIAQNCHQVQVQLRSMQKRDTVLRINRGRLYDMTLRQTGAFVARLEVNKIDAPVIKQADSAIRAEVQHFKDDYNTYGGQLDQLVDFDCATKPREFYTLLSQATASRKKVGEDVANIKKYISEYTGGLAALQAQRFPTQGGSQ